MFAHIEAYEHGHFSIPAYCTANDLKVPTFHYWRRKLREARCASSTFIPILTSAQEAAASVRVSYPNGVCIHLSAFDLPAIAQLIRLA